MFPLSSSTCLANFGTVALLPKNMPAIELLVLGLHLLTCEVFLQKLTTDRSTLIPRMWGGLTKTVGGLTWSCLPPSSPVIHVGHKAHHLFKVSHSWDCRQNLSRDLDQRCFLGSKLYYLCSVRVQVQSIFQSDQSVWLGLQFWIWLALHPRHCHREQHIWASQSWSFQLWGTPCSRCHAGCRWYLFSVHLLFWCTLELILHCRCDSFTLAPRPF